MSNDAFVIVDTEYTAWEDSLVTDWGGPGQEKEIVQIAAIKVDTSFKELCAFDLLVKPRINWALSAFFTSLTTISQKHVDEKGVDFAVALGLFHDFSGQGECPIICMNADETVFRNNCELNDVTFPFPKPWHRVRPFAEANGVDMKENSSGTLHMQTDAPLETAGHTHYALHDVRSMARYLGYMKRIGKLTGLEDLPTDRPLRDPRAGNGRVPTL